MFSASKNILLRAAARYLITVFWEISRATFKAINGWIQIGSKVTELNQHSQLFNLNDLNNYLSDAMLFLKIKIVINN